MKGTTQLPETLRQDLKVRNNRSTGLCATCLNSSNCCYTTSSNEPVHQCEEFEGFSPTVVEELEFRLSTRNEDAPAPVVEEIRGLCANCEKSANCSLRASEGTVWHCEEYA